MADITIVGLGPGPAELRTQAAQQALDNADHIYVRTHGDVDLGGLMDQPNVVDLGVYRDERGTSRWGEAARVAIEGANHGSIVIAVPGHPRFGEGLVREVIALAARRELSLEIIDGLSAADLLASALNVDPILDRVQMMSGREVLKIHKQSPFSGGLLDLSPRLPVLITHAYNHDVLTAIGKQLGRIFPSDHPVTVIHAAGLPDEHRIETPLDQLDQQAGGHLCAVFAPALADLEATNSASTLQHIVARLRRDDGCLWDREQSHSTLIQPMTDELYEMIDAINAGDDKNLAEELGDLLLLIMMQSQIAEERGSFTFEDVLHGIVSKLVRRHPHVFGDAAASSAGEVIALWQKVKGEEKARGIGTSRKAADGQPHSMPGLTRAQRVLNKYPVETTSDTTAEQRETDLLRATAAILAAGDTPDAAMKRALEKHIAAATAAQQGDEHASH